MQEQPRIGAAGTGKRDPRAHRHQAPQELSHPLPRGTAKTTPLSSFLVKNFQSGQSERAAVKWLSPGLSGLDEPQSPAQLDSACCLRPGCHRDLRPPPAPGLLPPAPSAWGTWT